MKKLILTISILLFIAGCSSPTVNKEETPQSTTDSVEDTNTPVDYSFKVLSPKGAPALAVIPLLEKNADDVTTVDGTDVLQAAFVNPDPEYDVIIAPSNLGSMLASKEKTNYKMLAIVTWGNLYVVGENEEALNSGTIALFGEGAVPGLVFEETMKDVSAEKVYYSAVAEAQAALLSGKADSALLAEPAATATIAKAKESGKELEIIADLQKKWVEANGNEGYPQAAIFVIQDKYDENKEEYDQMILDIQSFINDTKDSDKTELVELVDKYGVDVLGIPNGNIAKATFDRMNVNVVYANDYKSELESFLKLFNIDNLSNILITQ